jgi:hypothetical protein
MIAAEIQLGHEVREDIEQQQQAPDIEAGV